MAKAKTLYVCQNCGATTSKWLGRCNACGAWNSFVEEVRETTTTQASHTSVSPAQPVKLTEVTHKSEARINTQSEELNRVLGGGLVPGSVILIGGEPGIGKSTLVLQMALQLNHMRVLYVSGEESNTQIKLRADRMQGKSDNLYLYPEALLEHVIDQAQKTEPDLLVVDSVQTLRSEKLDSSPGTVSQIREGTDTLIQYAKSRNVPVFIIGHINKEGQLAGPKVLEHMVDTVLQFEGSTSQAYRMLRTIKNRFGSTSELALYEMRANGLHEILNPSEILLNQRPEDLSGVAIAAGIEGIRPLLIEVQALVSSAAYGTPQRSATGYDIKRLNMLLAVLEKRAGFKLATKDVFLNIAGGLKVADPAIDLGLVAAILSSELEHALPAHTCFAGEVGLSGEIRPVVRLEQRIKEAAKLGFRKIVISSYNHKDLTAGNIEMVRVAKLEEAMKKLFH